MATTTSSQKVDTTTTTTTMPTISKDQSGSDGGSEAVNMIPLDLELFQAITNGKLTENTLIAPFLLEALLALLYLGSDGSTAEELKRLMQLQRFPSNAKMANYFAAHLDVMAVGADASEIELNSQILLPEKASAAGGEEFTTIARKYFQTIVKQVGQEGLQKSLEELLGSMDLDQLADASQDGDDAATLLLDAAFRFKWFLPFSAYRSGIYDFHGLTINPTAAETTAAEQKDSIAVPMLFDDDMFVKFGEFRELDARAIELPCEHDAFELTILFILPNKRDGLSDMMEQLRHLDLHTLSEQRMQMESVQVLLPKFKINYTCTLRTALEKLGLTTLFTKAANFKNFSEGLRLGNLWHRCSIEVNESGSVPSNSVVNKPIVISNSINSKQKFFRADHPFFFAICAEAVTYFAGQVTQFPAS